MQMTTGEVAEFGSHGGPVRTTAALDLEDRLVVSVPEAARLLGMGRTKFWELVWSGDMPHIRKGRWVGIPLDELRKWVRKNTN